MFFIFFLNFSASIEWGDLIFAFRRYLMFWPLHNDNGIEIVLDPNLSAMHIAFSNRSVHKSFGSKKMI